MRARFIVVGAALLAGCASPTGPDDVDPDPDPDPDPVVSTVSVTSPIGPLIAVGRTAALSASATDAGGSAVAASLQWESSDESVATVSSSGIVTGLAPGTTAVTASVDGVSGRLDVTVADADLAAIQALLDDPFAGSLLSSLSDAHEAELRAAWSACADGRSTGSLSKIADCIGQARADLADGDDASTGPLLSLLGLFVDWIERHLNLS